MFDGRGGVQLPGEFGEPVLLLSAYREHCTFAPGVQLFLFPMGCSSKGYEAVFCFKVRTAEKLQGRVCIGDTRYALDLKNNDLLNVRRRIRVTVGPLCS